MLIETPYKIGDTVSIKLSSGEELISRLDDESNESVTLRKPLMVVGSSQGLGLAPFMFTVDSDAKLKIHTRNITCIHKTNDDMSKQYISSTTGIQTL